MQTTRRGITSYGPRVVILLAALYLASCSQTTAPVVLIGVDGFEWDVALPLIRAGRMPTLERLMRRGTFGELSTQAPAKSPVIWTTVVTGKEPPKHGILDFTRFNENGERVLYTSADRTTKALWNILSEAGQSISVIGWWNTFPVEAVSGTMVAQVNTLEQLTHRQRIRPGGVARGFTNQVYPVEREDEVFEIVEDVDRELPRLLEELYPEADLDNSPQDALKWDTCRWSLRADGTVMRIAQRIVRTRPFTDALLVHFGTTDIIGHHFWRYHEPGAFTNPPSAVRIRKLGGVLTRTYEHIDMMLGQLIQEMPNDVTVFVISDHGMQAKHVDGEFVAGNDDRPEKESGGHGSGPPGIIVAAGPPIRRSYVKRPIRELVRADLPTVGSVVDITPTILALRGLPAGDDMDGTVLKGLLRPGNLKLLGPRFIATHDTPEWLASQIARKDAVQRGLEERLEQLRSLGYLDGDLEKTDERREP